MITLDLAPGLRMVRCATHMPDLVFAQILRQWFSDESRAIVTQEALKIKLYVLNAIYGMAELVAAGDQLQRAVELAALVHHHPGTTPQFKSYAGDLLAELEATLPSDTYAEAIARGAALDLDTVVANLLAESAE
jgi:hypothetical protein